MVTAEEIRLEFEARKWTLCLPLAGENDKERLEKRKHLEQALSVRTEILNGTVDRRAC